jgi:hypothetical protein
MHDIARRPDSSGRTTSWLPWIAAAVLIAGVAAILVTFFHDRSAAESLPASASGTPIERPVEAQMVPLEPAARLVARRFILTAVARRNLTDAYDLVGAELRQSLTRAQWETGNIPVVPYPVSPVRATPTKVAYSYRNRALLEVTLHPRDGARANGVKIEPQPFYLELRANGKGKDRHWVVINWVPRGALSIPQAG